MKKWVCMLLLCAIACTASLAGATGVTIRTFTPFADVDFAAQGFMDLVTGWEEKTGNFVEDYSGVMDESWLDQMKQMIAAGEADLLIVPVGAGLSADELMTADELYEAAASAGVKVFSSMAETDGTVLLTPVRFNWEALYINTDVLAANGLAVPATLEDLVGVCAALSGKGVLPIANAPGDWAEILLDCLAYAGAPDAAYGSEQSLAGAKEALGLLAGAGAFGSDPLGLTDADVMEKFLSGEAAMRFDSDYLSYDVPQERMDSVTVIAAPTKSGTVGSQLVGTPGVGLAITRACWADDDRRAAALSLMEAILADTSLITPATGMLGAGAAQMTKSAQDCTGILYDAIPDSFDSWADGVVIEAMK